MLMARSNFDFNGIGKVAQSTLKHHHHSHSSEFEWINNEKLQNVSNKMFPLILMMRTKYANREASVRKQMCLFTLAAQRYTPWEKERERAVKLLNCTEMWIDTKTICKYPHFVPSTTHKLSSKPSTFVEESKRREEKRGVERSKILWLCCHS